MLFVIARVAKQSMAPHNANGLFRRCAPRNDGIEGASVVEKDLHYYEPASGEVVLASAGHHPLPPQPTRRTSSNAVERSIWP